MNGSRVREISHWPCWRGLVALTLLVLPSLLRGQPAGVHLQPPAEWVRQTEWRRTPSTSTTNQAEGSHYLLFERQIHAELKEEFERSVQLMRNEAGVQDSGNLTASFDPNYQQLFLHRVQIHRNGQVLNRLDKSKIKTIQPESGLDNHLFTGRKTAVLFVEDLRVGDVLEHSFTIRGVNPAIGDHFATRLLFQSGVPVDRQHFRVVWPFDRPLHQRLHRSELAPLRTPLAKGMEHVWNFTNLVALPYEDGTPMTFEPYPYCELSDFDDWASVVKWALPLYSGPETNLPPGLQKILDQWRLDIPSDEERARLALQMVQDDLRYTGLELGPDSYRPASVAETFERRFGDCKGKALLLCTMLRAMNIEAWPVLVNTLLRDAITRQLPSPFRFDHVIVKLKLHDRPIWVDPTISHQGGALTNRYLTPLGHGLVVQPGVSALEEIPVSPAPGRQHTLSTFRVVDYDSPALYSVTTTYHGRSADDMREELARQDREALLKNYLNFSARFYPGVTNGRPLQISDDRVGNVVTLSEQYQIRHLWTLDHSSNRWTAAFYADSLYNLLPEPTTRLRKHPLRIPFPIRREHDVTVHLPDSTWQIPETREAIDHEAFAFRYHRKLDGSVVTFHHELESKAPEIPAEQVESYLKKWKEVENQLGDTLQRPNQQQSALANINWLMVLVASFGFCIALAAGAGIWRWTQVPADMPPPLPERPDLQGLGGWLILVGFGVCVAPFLRLGQMLKHWEGYFSMDTWQIVAMRGGEQYHPLYGPLLTFEVLGNSVLLALNIALICMFFGKRRVFPKMYVALMLANIAFLVLDESIGNLIPFVSSQPDGSARRDLNRAVLQGLFWSAYMLTSKRVKATFVR